VDLRNYF